MKKSKIFTTFIFLSVCATLIAVSGIETAAAADEGFIISINSNYSTQDREFQNTDTITTVPLIFLI